MSKNKWQSAVIMLGILFCCTTQLWAQQRTITGTVTDKDGEAVIGASVIAKGSSQGTVTDLQGKFTLNVGPAVKSITVSYVGMVTVEETIKAGPMKIVLQDDARTLDDVVVIGYGTAKKRDLTGSVTSIQGTTIAQIPVTGTAQAMTGRLAGVQVTTADGSPDAEILIRVRGGGSITNDNSPLYIVDGFPSASLANISPTDIQSIDVLKDASATAIYGSQGANGVVIITTKSAQGGKTQVSYNGFMQSKQLSKRMEVLNPFEYAKLNYELSALSGADGIRAYESRFGYYDDIDLYQYQRGRDWQDDLFGANVVSQQHNLSINGGSDKTKFSLSTTYNYDGGLMENNNYNRFTTNFKLNHEISKNLKANFNLRFADTEVNGSGSSGGTYKIRTSQAVTSPATNGLSDQVVIDPNLLSEEDYEQWQRANMSLSQQAQQYWKKRNDRTINFLGSLDWTIVKGLVYRMEGGYEHGFKDDQNYWGQNTTNASYVDGKPLVDWTKTYSTRARLSNLLTYNTKFGQNSITTMVGQEMNDLSSNNTYLYATGFGTDLTPDVIFANLGLGGATKNISSYSIDPVRSLSYFGRANYNYKDKYLATITFRADAVNKFDENYRWAYFPAASAAWRINEESFMSGTKEWLSNFKLRAGYGVAGNSNIPTGLIYAMYKIYATKTYGLGDVQNNYWANASDQLPNPDLRWERNITENIALDFGLFNEKLNGTLELYKNQATDLLLTTPIVAPGFTKTTRNVGQTSNRGVEVTLNATAFKSKNFVLNGSFNIAINKTNVDKLAENITVQEYASGWAGTDLKGYYDYRVEVGQPVGLMYGWVSDGYYTTADFEKYDAATGKYVLNPGVPTIGFLGGRIGTRPGTAKYKDLNDDDVIDEKDRTIIGKAAPKALGGFGLNGTLYNFDFQFLFSYVYGNQIYNANKIASAQQYRTSDPNMLNIMRQDNRYTYLNNETGQIVTDLETLAAMNEGENAKEYWSPFSFGNATVLPSSWAVEDGSFLRLQNVTLGYTLPKKLTKKLGGSMFRAYCTVNNVFVLTNYSGYDPEVNTAVRSSSASGLTPGVDYSSYPKSLAVTMGLNVTF